MAYPAGIEKFLQLYKAQRTQHLWGSVFLSSGVYTVTPGSSGGVLVARNGANVGDCVIAFTNPFANVGYGFAASVIQGAGPVSGYCVVAAGQQLTGSIELLTFNTANAATDLPFTFLISGQT